MGTFSPHIEAISLRALAQWCEMTSKLTDSEIDAFLATPQDDEYHELVDKAYRIADSRYQKNSGQMFYEELLLRGLIGLMRASQKS